ncbi:GNAT family N-acetyltransferase [Nocardiopsis ansamitocini]|uniref:N-acetyltransferase domain-containing protein n=1 Tax=Nocardiopsis ansamitocini TaxID=1670832 RepID=A0A9W6UKH6_9ACTN|nr:GNAT family N-acetyltransferase [Nocardiopsis ansamitocini]GLU49070.1 hypothetical protein Nans01_34210 [Nocardiopsis ansamitocini]
MVSDDRAGVGFTLGRPVPDDINGVLACRATPAPDGAAAPGLLPGEEDHIRAMVDSWIGDWHDRGIGYWVLRGRAHAGSGSRPILGEGGVRYSPTPVGEVFNLYYRLDFRVRGRGWARLLARLAVIAAHAHDPDTVVIARMAPDNHASHRTALAAGLRPVGRDASGRLALADRPIDGRLTWALAAL